MVKKSNASQLLFTVSNIDLRVAEVNKRKKDVEAKLELAFKEIARLRSSLGQMEAKVHEGAVRQTTEEERLREEERKIVERRRQLTTLGGTKSAKLVEREIDIASRTLQTMEQRALQAIEEVDHLQAEIDVLKSALESKQLESEASRAEDEKIIEESKQELEKLMHDRDAVISQLDDRVRNLYVRVNNRYPGGAVAKAEGGACRSCFRALPVQTFNQVLAGNLLIQCPGCSRILVAVTSE